MDHNDIRHKLSDYIDGAVSEKDKAEIEAHLKTCATCSEALAELRKTIEYVKEIEEVESPAWMKQKIMAQVRAEVEKRSIFQRIFYPLSVKLPIQAVAVLFLAVTAYYLYQNGTPAEKYAETPAEVTARKDALSADKIAKKETSIQAPAQREKKVEQGPGYKSLDMKYSYEKPAPPVPLGKAPAPESVPAPAAAPVQKPAEQPELEKRAATPDVAAPARREEQTAGAAPAEEMKLKSAPPARQALSAVPAYKAGQSIIVQVKDIEAADRKVEQAVTQLGGMVIGKEHPEAKKIYRVSINAQRLPEFRNRLKLIGEVKDETVALGLQDSRIELKIELVGNLSQP